MNSSLIVFILVVYIYFIIYTLNSDNLIINKHLVKFVLVTYAAVPFDIGADMIQNLVRFGVLHVILQQLLHLVTKKLNVFDSDCN